MNLNLLTITLSFWIGLLTCLSPCPLATNITAISFLTNKLPNFKQIIIVGILYTLGRCFTYVALAILILKGLFLSSNISHFLQKYLNLILGPLLIFIGMLLLNLLEIKLPSLLKSNCFEQRLAQSKYFGSFALGILFALSFCPISAALYFGSLVPLALQEKSIFMLPLVYGLGSSLPVLLLAILSVFGIQKISKFFSCISKIEKGSRILTGSIFVLVGIYYTLVYIFEVKL